jgi:signal transduction histidine kinase
MVRIRSWSLGSRITALTIGVGLLLSLIAVTAAMTAVTTRKDITLLVDRISPARADAERLMSLALAQHAGVTQYAASGQSQFRDQYSRAVTEEDALYTQTRRRLEGEASLLRQLEGIRTDLRQWRADVADPLVSSVAADGADPRKASLPPEGQARFDGVVASINAFQQQVIATHDRLSEQVRESSNSVVTLLFSAAVLVVIAGVLLYLVLTRFVTRPVVALAAEVRRVADGDYEYKISSTGPPEVERLARDVEGMRQQIAADLSAVGSARREVEDANRQLESQAAELTRSNRDLEQFAYVASHDLQEPLRKVASFCQLLQRRYGGQLDERADQYIYFAVDGAQRMQRLINDLLAFSRIGRMTTGFADVDLNRVVDDIVAQREPVGGSITRDDLPVVRGEEPLLAALLSNLVANSVKFRRPGTPAKVHVGAALVDDEWQVYVRDNGIGIGREFADKVFMIFQRLHTKEAYPGTGIGLSIAKKIVEYHGGRIWIDTDYAEGTLIRFTLPAAVPAPPGADAEPPAIATPASALPESRVEEPAS